MDFRRLILLWENFRSQPLTVARLKKTFGITYMYIYIHACTHVRAGLINCWGCGLRCNRKEPHGKSPWAVLEIFLGQLHGYSAWQRSLLAQVTLVLHTSPSDALISLTHQNSTRRFSLQNNCSRR